VISVQYGLNNYADDVGLQFSNSARKIE
jgi:hypothetical protein